MIGEALLATFFVFTFVVPVFPVILWHIGKGLWEEAKERWFG